MDASPSSSPLASGSIITGEIRKRSSPEGTNGSSFSKRIKHENDAIQDQDQDQPMTSVEEDDDQIDYGDDDDQMVNDYMQLLNPNVTLEKFDLPVTIDAFISSIIRVDPTFHSLTKVAEVFNVQSKLRDVTNKLTFESREIYSLHYLPVVLYSFCNALSKAVEQRRQTIASEPNTYYEDIYLLMKEEFNTELDLKCIKFRPKHIFDGPVVGDLCLVKAKSIRYPNTKEVTFEENCHFGIFLSGHTRVTMPDVYALDKTFLNSLPEEQRDDQICEESIIRVRHDKSLLIRTDFQLGIFKLVNCLFHMLQAKALYLTGENQFQDHFLQPVMVIKHSGMSFEENLPLPPETLDTIQKAIDLVGQNDLSSSCFLAIDFSDQSGYFTVLEPILKQITLNMPYFKTKDELTPILVISKDRDSLQQLHYNLLRESNYGENGVILDPSPSAASQVDRNLIALYRNHIASLQHNREQMMKGIERYTKCIEYLEKNRSIDDLAARWIVDMQRKRKETKRKLLSKAKIILTDLDHMFKDEQYLLNFNPKTANQQRILCCVLMDAHLFTETETICLTNFGVNKFIFIGNSSLQLPPEEQLTPRGLTRSLFHRLQQIDARNQEKSPYSAYVKL